ncbi:MAG: 50S ribosome-binding GTPase, partial [Corynebacterium casei]|nr:50S ribosome-binding GTPase [Corynebacterium casei]
MSDKNSEKDTEFHYPAGKFDEELVEAPHGGWASDDFNEEEFDFEFDDSNFDDSEFGEADYGDGYDEEGVPTGVAGEELSEEEWAQIERAFGVAGPSHTEESLCTVAIVGRPNVGKSSLVNRFLGRREAVVEDHPGVTRDRISYIGDWNGQRFFVQDTGGWDPNAKGIHGAIARQAEVAMETADVIVFVVDTKV